MDDSALLRHLLDALPDAVFFKDEKGRYLRVNGVLASWYGLKDPDEAVGKTDADFFPQEFARTTADSERVLLKKGIPILDQEEKVVGRDGKTRWVSTTKLPLLNRRGRPVGVLGISRDIRELKQAERKARDSEALYQSLIEALPQCIFRKDAEGRFVYVNRRFCEMLGPSPEQILGKTDFDVCPRDLAEKYRRDDQWVMNHQKTFETVEELKAVHRKIKVRVFKTPVYDAGGRVVGIQGVFSPLPGEEA